MPDTSPPIQAPDEKRVMVELPDVGVTASLLLYSADAPTSTSAILRALEQPLETSTSHACFDGHEIFCFLPPLPERPPLENRTLRPVPGEVMLFYADAHEFACLADARLTAGAFPMWELAFMYDRVDLRYLDEEGLHGALVGRIDVGFEEFAKACRATLQGGSTSLRLSIQDPSA